MKSDLLRNTEIFVFLALVFSIFTAVLLSNQAALSEKGIILGDHIKEVTDKYEKCKDSLDGYRKFYENLEDKYKKSKDSLDSIKSKQSKTPSHIEIKGTEQFYFESGEFKIKNNFKKYLLKTIVPKLDTLLNNCKSCNAIYIVGHTDGTNATNKSNHSFDENIVQIINGSNFDFDFNSNTDLGIQRAMSIYSLLKKQTQLKDRVKYWFPYSAGPFINPESGKLINKIHDKKDPAKRRIELWVYAYETKK